MRLDTCIINSAANLVLEAVVNSCSCNAMSVENTPFLSFGTLMLTDEHQVKAVLLP